MVGINVSEGVKVDVRVSVAVAVGSSVTSEAGVGVPLSQL